MVITQNMSRDSSKEKYETEVIRLDFYIRDNYEKKMYM